MALKYDEFNDSDIAAFWTQQRQGETGTLIEQADKLIGRATGAYPAHITSVSQPYPASSEFDVWVKAQFTGVPGVDYSNQQVNIWPWDDDFTVWMFLSFTYNNEGGCGSAEYADRWQIHAEMDNNVDWERVCVNIDQDYAWLRLKKEPAGVWRFFYSLTEPVATDDWVEIFLPAPVLWEPLDVSTLDKLWLDFTTVYATLTGYPKDTYIHFVRGWGTLPAEPPSVDQYQRLQGYPKTIHQLVFNRDTGVFEVMTQPETLPPRPLDNPDHTLGYDGNGNLSTIDMDMGAITYRKTLTYTAGNLTGVSVWVEQ